MNKTINPGSIAIDNDVVPKLCDCIGWERLPNYGKLPLSEHHPNCEYYKLEEFVLVVEDGQRLIFEVGEIDDPRATTIFLTRDQYENLQEFQGY